MKIQELRDLLSKTERELVEKAFSESYKKFAKAQKEEVDQIITDILEGKKSSGRKEEPRDFEALEQEINTFIENAYAQNYFAPNRVIPKNQRAKWRFLVKAYIKELLKIQSNSDYYSRMAKLMMDLYKMLCAACNYYLFSTEDPFRSIGWNQAELFSCVVKSAFGQGYSRENISAMLVLASAGGLSRESLHIEQQFVLLSELKTADVKYMAIEETKKLIEEREIRINKPRKYDSGRYDEEEKINNLCEMLLITAIALGEGEDGIRYFFNNCREYDKEITLYRMLRLLEVMEEDDLWIKAYEFGLKKKIKPRDALVKEYERHCSAKESR